MSKQQLAKVDAMLRQPRPEGQRSVEQLRAGFRALMATMIMPDDVCTVRTTLGGRPALHVTPDKGARAGTILYFHGGGFVFGSPETALSLTAQLVSKTGFDAYSVDYRLAPEHPFPAGLEDNLSAYRALLDSRLDPAAIAFAGDSAGGGYSITTALAARDEGLALPAAIVAFSPGLDATRTGESMTTKDGIDPIFTREAVMHTGAMYLAGQDPEQPLLSPALFADLTGFPRSSSRWAPTRSSSTTPPASPPAHATPESTSSSTSRPMPPTSSSPSPAAPSTKPTTHSTAPPSSSLSTSPRPDTAPTTVGSAPARGRAPARPVGKLNVTWATLRRVWVRRRDGCC